MRKTNYEKLISKLRTQFMQNLFVKIEFAIHIPTMADVLVITSETEIFGEKHTFYEEVSVFNRQYLGDYISKHQDEFFNAILKGDN